MITTGTGAVEDEEAIGLVSGHAYAVLEDMDFGKDKLLLVKNPWGHFEYKGKFS